MGQVVLMARKGGRETFVRRPRREMERLAPAVLIEIRHQIVVLVVKARVVRLPPFKATRLLVPVNALVVAGRGRDRVAPEHLAQYAGNVRGHSKSANFAVTYGKPHHMSRRPAVKNEVTRRSDDVRRAGFPIVLNRVSRIVSSRVRRAFPDCFEISTQAHPLRTVRFPVPLSFTRKQMSLRLRTGSENSPDPTHTVPSSPEPNKTVLCSLEYQGQRTDINYYFQ